MASHSQIPICAAENLIPTLFEPSKMKGLEFFAVRHYRGMSMRQALGAQSSTSSSSSAYVEDEDANDCQELLQARMPLMTCPCTSVRLTSRPPKRYVSFL